jgi:hypothetical protein
MLDTTVRAFMSTDPGAPVGASNVAGSDLAILDAALVNGYGEASVTSIVVTDGIATVTTATNHGFSNFPGFDYGPVARIAGATPAGLNVDARVSVIDSTNFTYEVTGVANGPATGTITSKRAPLGWTIAFTGTNIRVYKAPNPFAPSPYIRVDNSTTSAQSRVRGYTTMSGLDTGTNPFPTEAQVAGGAYAHHSASAFTRDWAVVGDGTSFFYQNNNDGSNWWGGFAFTVLTNKSPSDLECRFLAAAYSGSQQSWLLTGGLGSTNCCWVSGAADGTLGSLPQLRYTPLKSGTMTQGESVFPIPSGVHRFYPMEVWATASVYRGIIPGLLLTGCNQWTMGSIIAVAGKPALVLKNGSLHLVDILGPWVD